MNAIHQSAKVCFALALSSLVLVISPGRILAGTLNPNQIPSITMTVQGSPTTWDYTPPAGLYDPATNSDGGYELRSDLYYDGVCDNTTNVAIEKLQFNSDPFVLNNLLVTNTTTTTQIYSVTVGLPTSFGAPNLISGNVTTSVIDGGTDGATVSTVTGQPIYKAQIDFGTVATLQNHPFSVSTSGSSSASASFGPTVSAIPVGANIGIVLTFQLTAGDTAAILSRFDVVPEPSSIALLVLGCVCIATRRR
jgi:hypothetical protein